MGLERLVDFLDHVAVEVVEFVHRESEEWRWFEIWWTSMLGLHVNFFQQCV